MPFPDSITAVSFGGVPAASFFETFSNGGYQVIIKAVVGDGASGAVKITGAAPVCGNSNWYALNGFTFVPPADKEILFCDSIANTILASNLSGTNYQWQRSTDSTNYTNLTDDNVYTGASTDSLRLTGISYLQHGYKYRCMVDGKATRAFIVKFENRWIGVSGTDWNNPLNWSCGTVPSNASNVVISQGNVILNSSVTINSLIIKAGVNFTVAAGAVITIIH